MRFTDAPFSSPFRTAQSAPARDPATTGSIGRAASPGISQGAPLPAAPAVASVRSQPLPPPQSAVALRSAAPIATGGSASGWSATGGTPIVVAQGETLDMISSRYGVPKAALISSNGLSGSSVAPGSRLTIPVYNAAGASAPAAAPRQMAQSAQTQSDARPEPVRSAPVAAARTAPVPPVDPKVKAAADAQAMRDSRARFAAEAKAKAEARKTGTAPVAAAAPAPKVTEARKPTPVAEKAKPVVVASAPAEPKAAPVAKTVVAEPKVDARPDPKSTASIAKTEEPAAEKADFRWPARGRVIAGFSGKGGNEGINIAVPEGTPIKAAEGGTVAYAGNELKGYGNLVLIRHPNGYVSAYAHNGALNVKRGDAIKRGQVVATAGQTGNVSSPQLHFELRKGSTPVDPTPYLSN